MSFSQEMKDFTAGFQASSAAVGDMQDRQMKKEAFDLEKEERKAKMFESLLGPDPAKGAKKPKPVTTADAGTDPAAGWEGDFVDDDGPPAPTPPKADEPDKGWNVMGVNIPKFWANGGMVTSESNYSNGQADPYASYAIPPMPVSQGTPEDGILLAQGGKVESARDLPRRKRGRRKDGTLDPLVGVVASDDSITPVSEMSREAIPTQPRPDDPAAQAMRAAGHEPSQGPGFGGQGDRSGQQVDAKGRPMRPTIFDAIKSAMDGWTKQPQSAVGGEPDIDFVTGRGAATSEDIRAMNQKIDPNGQMDPWDLGHARLLEGYNFFIQQGMPQKAQRMAQQLLLHDKMASEARGKLSLQLINGGDDAGAAKVLSDAYNENLHDGKRIQVGQPQNGMFPFQIIDRESGKVVQQGQGSRDQLKQMAGTVASGTAFNESVAAVAAAGDPTAEPDETPATEAPTAQPAAAPAAAEAIPSAEAAAPAAAAPAAAEATPAPAAPAAPTTPAPGTPAAPAAAIPDPAAAAPAPVATTPSKGSRKKDLFWARDQYQKAFGAKNYWDAKVEEDPSDENRMKQYYASQALESTVSHIADMRQSTIKRDKNGKLSTDPNQVLSGLMKDMNSWEASAADYTDDNPPPMTRAEKQALDLKQAAQPNAAGAIPAEAGPAGPAGPAPAASGGLRPPTPQELSDAKQLIAAGTPVEEVAAHMQRKGVSTEGL